MSHWGINNALNIVVNKNNLKNKYICISRFDINNYTGPLHIDIISIIYGSLLGDAHAEKRKGGKEQEYLFIKKEVIQIIYYIYIIWWVI